MLMMRRGNAVEHRLFQDPHETGQHHQLYARLLKQPDQFHFYVGSSRVRKCPGGR